MLQTLLTCMIRYNVRHGTNICVLLQSRLQLLNLNAEEVIPSIFQISSYNVMKHFAEVDSSKKYSDNQA